MFKPFSILLGLLLLALAAEAQPTVLVAYYSRSGNTHQMAEAVARGASTVAGIKVVLKPVGEVSTADLLEAGAIIVGSPVYNANLAPAVQEFINSWPFEGQPLKNKLGAAFTTGGGISIGEEGTLLNILHSMLIFGMIVMGGDETNAAFGASAITGEEPFQTAGGEISGQFIQKAEGLGRRVGEVLKRWEE